MTVTTMHPDEEVARGQGVAAKGTHAGSGQHSGHLVPLDTTFVVDTPEQVRFSYRLAGPAQRAVAYLLDLLIRGVVMSGLGLLGVIGGAAGESGLAGVGTGLLLLALFLVEWGYYVLCEVTMNGQSPGKRALKLRVVKLDGLPIRFSDSLLRNVLRAADFLPAGYAIGVGVMAFDRQFRRLGDMAAGTVVISEARSDVVPPVTLEPPAKASELQKLPAAVPLSADDLQAIEVFLRRQGQLSPERNAELAEIVAPLYARRMSVRYRNPVRFLALLYHRATGERGGE